MVCFCLVLLFGLISFISAAAAAAAAADVDNVAAAVTQWHFHVPFVSANPIALQAALAWRRRFAAAFALQAARSTDPDICPGLSSKSGNTRLCLQPPKCTQGGVFVNGHWSAWAPADAQNFTAVVTWLAQHRHTGDGPSAFDFMVHPLTDFKHLGSSHYNWSFWGGSPWPLNTDAYHNGNGQGTRLKSTACPEPW